MKTKFVILGEGGDRALLSFADILNDEDIQFIPDFYAKLNPLLRLLFKIHITPRINRKIKLPLKKGWVNLVLKDIKFKHDEKICFVLFNIWIKYDELDVIGYIRRNYPKAKIVWNLRDIVKSLLSLETRGPLNIPDIMRRIDGAFSYDQGDCSRYGFHYYPLVFSQYKGKVEKMPYSDVFFVGMAKDRLNTILKVYECCKSKGLRCDFIIVGVKEKDQKYTDDIIYNKKISYYENIQHIIHTKCIIDVIQGGSVGYTQRISEAICLRKKILSNNPYIEEAPFYEKEYISYFESPTKIDMDFLKNIHNEDIVNYDYQDKLSPRKFLEEIDEIICD